MGQGGGWVGGGGVRVDVNEELKFFGKFKKKIFFWGGGGVGSGGGGGSVAEGVRWGGGVGLVGGGGQGGCELNVGGRG